MHERNLRTGRSSAGISFHSIQGRFATLVAIALLAVMSIAWLSHVRSKEIQVTGPLYHRIVQDKDVIADVLPPPEYIIETYLVAHEMLRETREVELGVLVEKARSLRSDFDTRHEYWAKELGQDGVRQALIETSYKPALQFFAVFDGEFIPAVRNHDTALAAKVLDDKLTPLYTQHRTAIDQVVALATARSAQTEASTPAEIASNTNLAIGFAIVMFILLATTGWYFTRAILNPFNETVSVLEGIAAGDLSRTASESQLSDVRRLGDALNGSLLGMREALGTDKVDWEELGRQRLAAKTTQAREIAMLEAQRETEQADAERRRRAADERLEEQRRKSEAENAQAEALRRRVDAILEVVSAAGRGDLTLQVPVEGSDAVAHLGDGLNGFFANLSRSITNIARTAEDVSSSSEQMNQVGQRLGETASSAAVQAGAVATAADEVASNVQTVAAATEEMSASIREIARSASEAAHVASHAVHVAERTNSTVSKLGDSSAEIGKVIKVITSIAQQTNLLALNATIEAARAGEAGKGFAVVANEVKELAKETARATEEIGHKIEAIQADTGDAVAAIREISAIILQISDTQTTIAAAVEEQTATTKDMSRNVSEAARGVKEIAENIQGVAHTAQTATDGARQSQTAAGDLARAAQDLQALVAQFRIADEVPQKPAARRPQSPSLRVVVPRR